MPDRVNASNSLVDSLDGIAAYDWTTTPTTWLGLHNAQISRIESGTFDGLASLLYLDLNDNQISNIESGAFEGLASLTFLNLKDNQISNIKAGAFERLASLVYLYLFNNQISIIESGSFSGLMDLQELVLGDNHTLTKLNLDFANFSSLRLFDVRENKAVTSVSMKNIIINQSSLTALLDRSGCGFSQCIGISKLDGINEMDLSDLDFADITDLTPFYEMDDLIDLRLLNTQNMNATDLDILLDNLDTIEGTGADGILYMTPADFDAFNTAGGGLLAAWDEEPGHHVEFVIPEPADLNIDGFVDGLDLSILLGNFDQNGIPASGGELSGANPVDGLDLGILLGAWNPPSRSPAATVPEPSTIMLLAGLVAIGLNTSRARCVGIRRST